VFDWRAPNSTQQDAIPYALTTPRDVPLPGIFLENKFRGGGQIESFRNRGGQNFNHIKINFITTYVETS